MIFVWWQARNTQEPLVPLGLFKDRNFSVSNVAISAMGFAATAMGFPLMLYAQLVRGLPRPRPALLMVPMALMSIVLAPMVGKLTDKVHPRLLTGIRLRDDRLDPLAVPRHDARPRTWGRSCCRWPCSASAWPASGHPSATATRNLPMHLAGAGAGVYNATRQVGSVLGSAAIAVLMDAGSRPRACRR